MWYFEIVCAQDMYAETTCNTTNAMKKRGKPRKVSERDTRTLIRNLHNLRKNNVHVTVKGLVEESGLSFKSASRTFSRCLNRLGYSYYSARRKGVLTEKDKKLRCQFARNMQVEVSRNSEFWKHEISFYLDGVSFIHKYNPQSGAASNRA